MRIINRCLLVVAFLLVLVNSNSIGNTNKKVLIVGKVIGLVPEYTLNVDEVNNNGKIQTSKQSIGVLTCIDIENNDFISLCHGIYNNGKLININNGYCYGINDLYIEKSNSHSLGSFDALINRSNQIGNLKENTYNAVYGTVEDISQFYEENLVFEVASKNEVKTGKAQIYLDLFGYGIEKFDIEIESIDFFNSNQNLEIRIVDERLIELTGGVVKGMSGSPIIQNGKFVGAINYGTEDDALTGCAIFAENL